MSTRQFIVIAAVAGLIAFVGDYVLPFILGFFYPNYNHLTLVQSELGTSVSPVSAWINTWWVLFGVLNIVFGLGFWQAFNHEGRMALVVGILIIVFGLGAGVGAGLFPQEPGGVETTLSGKLHGIFAGIGELVIILVPLLNLWIFTRQTSEPLFWASIATFVLSLLTFGLFLGGHDMPTEGILSYVGLWQRAYFLVIYVYLGTIAVHMIR